LITAIDTNVISAIISNEPSEILLAELLGTALNQGKLVICGAAYAELTAHPLVGVEGIDFFLSHGQISVDTSCSLEMWLEAGKAYSRYVERRRRASEREPKRLLMDFIVGAHAFLNADRLLTLDRSRYSRDFPKLRLQ